MDDGRLLWVEEFSSTKDRWKLTLLEGLLRLEREDGSESHEIARSEYGGDLDLRKMLGSSHALVVKMPKSKAFQLDAEAYQVVEDWLRPYTRADVATILRARLKWTLPIALLFMVTSIPLPGDPEQGVPAVPLDLVGFALGAGLIALGVLARKRPHPVLFLADAIWFLLLAVQNVWMVAARGSSPWWMLFSAFLIWVAMTPLGFYRRFRSVE